MQRKKLHSATKNTYPKSGEISNVSNRIGIICQMNYGNGFPTFKGVEYSFNQFEDTVKEQRASPASEEHVEACMAKLIEYHIYGLPIDQEFLRALLSYITIRKLAGDTLLHQKSNTRGFLITIEMETGEFRTEAMNYEQWDCFKQEMERVCNKKFSYN